MGVTLTDVLLFGKAQLADVDKATLVIYRRNILRWSALGGYLDIIVKGVSPLSLPDAVAGSLSYVKAFGGTEQRNLPSGYTELEYIESTGTQYIDPNVSGNARWVITAQTNAIKGSSQVLISSTPNAAGGSWYGEFTSAGHWDIVSGGTNIPPTTKTTADLTFDGDGVRGTIGSTSVSRSATVTQDTWRIFVTTGGSYPFVGKLFDAKVYQNGTLVRNFVPAKRDSDGVIGMYDTVSGTFFTNKGTGTFVAGGEAVPTPDAPVDIVSNNGVLKWDSVNQKIYTDGTVETIEIMRKNLLDTRPSNLSYYGANSGTLAYYSDNSRHSYILDMAKVGLSSGDTVTLSCTSRGTSSYWNVGTYASIADGQATLSYDNNVTVLSKTFTIPDGAHYIVVFNGTGYAENQMIERGDQATEYEPYGQIYTDGMVETIGDSANHTATVATLLGVGNYRDTQNINTGAITRRVGVKVLDGTENWTLADTSKFALNNDYMRNYNYTPTFCTHYKSVLSDRTSMVGLGEVGLFASGGQGASPARLVIGDGNHTSVGTFKQYLAEQYAAGTPVMIVYPLATETTESVAGQTLQVTDGDNVLEITQASLSNLELEAQYQAAVSLTIQEVQDANLDPNVEVTIN